MNEENKIPEPVVLRTIELLHARLGIGKPAAEQRVRDMVAMAECLMQASDELDE